MTHTFTTSHYAECASMKDRKALCTCEALYDEHYGEENTPDVAPDYGLPLTAYLGKQ